MSDEQPYSKREQDHYFQDMFKRMDSQDRVLSRIESQTIKTNGRVSKLEWWKAVLIWAFGVMLLFLVPITIHFIFK